MSIAISRLGSTETPKRLENQAATSARAAGRPALLGYRWLAGSRAAADILSRSGRGVGRSGSPIEGQWTSRPAASARRASVPAPQEIARQRASRRSVPCSPSDLTVSVREGGSIAAGRAYRAAGQLPQTALGRRIDDDHHLFLERDAVRLFHAALISRATRSTSWAEAPPFHDVVAW